MRAGWGFSLDPRAYDSTETPGNLLTADLKELSLIR